MLKLKSVQSADRVRLRRIVEAYWQELMPHADVLQDDARRTHYFQERFPEKANHRLVQWAIAEERTVGFVAVTLEPTRKQATVEDFYVLPDERRRGFGAAMVRALYQQFDTFGIELVELNVRRDNPQALAFWEAQGFRVALYQMRQYRDPETGESFIGALSSDFE